MNYICTNCHKFFTRNRGEKDKNYTLRFCCKECHNEYRRIEYINKFNGIYGDRFKIISFIDNKVIIRCKKCGCEFQRNTKLVWQYNLACHNCINIDKQHKDAILNDLKDKRKRINKLIKRLDKCKLYLDTHITKCEVCGKEYIYKGNSKYCSSRCSKNKWNRQRSKIHELKRENRIKNNGVIDKDITLEKLYIRDNGVCYLCGDKCNYDDYKLTDKGYFVAGLRYPSIDHIKALSKGGTHTWDNVKLAHFICNSKKRDR